MLLGKTSTLEGLQQDPVGIKQIEERTLLAQKQIENILKEQVRLLAEAEALKSLLDEFEAIIRAELQ